MQPWVNWQLRASLLHSRLNTHWQEHAKPFPLFSVVFLLSTIRTLTKDNRYVLSQHRNHYIMLHILHPVLLAFRVNRFSCLKILTWKMCFFPPFYFIIIILHLPWWRFLSSLKAWTIFHAIWFGLSKRCYDEFVSCSRFWIGQYSYLQGPPPTHTIKWDSLICF